MAGDLDGNPVAFRRLGLRSEFSGEEHLLHIADWGPLASGRVALCIHGFLGNGREFDPLARALAGRGWRVLCPDLAGHGGSSRRRNYRDYGGALHLGDLHRLLNAARVADPCIVGSSFGAVLALNMALGGGVAVRRLVLNDAGPYATREALTRVQALAPPSVRYPDFATAEAALRHYWSERDPLAADDWRAAIATSMTPHGKNWLLLHDPRLVLRLGEEVRDHERLERWATLACPTLLFRGADSLMLPAEIAERMLEMRPETALVTVPGCGHRPWLRAPAHVARIVEWLEADPAGATRARSTTRAPPAMLPLHPLGTSLE